MNVLKTPQEEQAARAWLHDLFIAAEIRTDNHRDTPLHFTPEFVKHAKILCKELMNRDCSNVDASILCLANYTYNASLAKGETILAQPTPEQIAKYLVYMAQQIDVFWDFRDKNLVCRMDFGETLLGHQVYVYRQYLWSRDQKSGVIHPVQRKIYKIENVGSGWTSLAQINPSSPHSNDAGTNIVKMSIKSASNSQCICYFFDQADAAAFLAKMIGSGQVDSRLKNIQVVEQGYVADEGYLRFGTEFGDCVVEKSELKAVWKYHVDCYKNGNPYNNMSDEQWECFVEALRKD